MKIKSKLLTLVIAFCLVFSFTALAFAAADISGHWAQATIKQCLNKGIVAGMPDGTFQPDKNVTRAEFVTMVNKTFGFEDADTDKTFSDVKSNDWYAEQVAIAAKEGYVAGMPDGTFKPLRQITRAEASVMICKAAGLSEGDENALSVFKDAGNIPAYAKGSISALVSKKLIKGCPDGTFRPLAQITRAESLVMNYNASTGGLEEPSIEEPDKEEPGKEEPQPGEEISVTGVELDKTSVSIREGKTVQLKATVKPEEATNKDLEWTTNDEKIAIVDKNGLVEGIKKGTATITVTTKDGEKTATCKVEVTGRSSGGGGGGGSSSRKVAVTGVKVEPSSATLEVGGISQLKAVVEPDNASNKDVTWKSNNESVVTVDQDGLVKAVAEGTAKITVTTKDGSKTASCTVSVVVRKSDLKAKIAEVAGLVEENYISESWEALQIALTAANAVAADEDADQETVDQALAELTAAIAGLETVTEEVATAKANLAKEVAAKVTEVEIPTDVAALAFNQDTKSTTITIVDETAAVDSISGTGAMVVLAEMEEVRGYKLGGAARNFYNEAGERVDNATIKRWIIEDTTAALELTGQETNLGVLIDKNFSVEVIGKSGRVDFTDSYAFEFVKDPNKAAADEVINGINALPSAEDLTLENYDAVAAAREAYDLLTDAQQTLVTNVTVLEAAEAKMRDLVKTVPAPYMVDMGITLYDEDGTNPIPGEITRNDNGSFYITVPKSKFVDMNSAALTFNEGVVLSSSDETPIPGNMYAKNIADDGMEGTITIKDAEIVTLKVKSEDGVHWTSSESNQFLEEVGEAVVLWNRLYKADCGKNASFMAGIAKNKYGVSNKKYDITAVERAGDLTIMLVPADLERVNITYHLNQAESQIVTIGAGGKAVLPAVSARAGYELIGWYTEPEYQNVYDFNSDVMHDIDLYAKWEMDDTADLSWYTEDPNATTYQISSTEGLVGLAMLVNGDVDGLSPNSFSGKTIELAADISLAGINWVPIGNSTATCFGGTFDGKNHTISNLTIENGGDHYGLFGDTSSSATLKNLMLDNANLVVGSDSAAVVGYLYGNIENCHVTNSVLEGEQRIGCIVGGNYGDIERCSVVNSSITGGQKVAGIVGFSPAGNVRNCYSNATVKGTIFGWDCGGLVGYFRGGEILNSYYYGSYSRFVGNFDTEKSEMINSFYRASSSSDSGDEGIPKTEEDLKKASTYIDAGWDQKVWNIVDGSYPTLNTELENQAAQAAVDEGVTVYEEATIESLENITAAEDKVADAENEVTIEEPEESTETEVDTEAQENEEEA